jgi:hypothetical protein
MEVNDKCPWCGSVISHDKFVQIQQERKKFEQAEAAIRQRLEVEFSQKVEDATREATKQAQAQRESAEAEKKNMQQRLEAEKRAALEQAKREAEAEREKMNAQVLEAQVKAAEAHKQAQAEKESAEAMKKNLQQQLEAEKKAALQEGKHEAQNEFAAREAEFAKSREQVRQLQVSAAEAQRLAQQERDAKAALERSFGQQLEAARNAAAKSAKEEAVALLKGEMEHQRIILQQTHDADLMKEKSEAFKQTEALLKKVNELQHKLEQKTADQLGDGAEVDLHETLRQEFPADKITRVPKGQPGPDIRHWVMYKGEKCGQIVYDSKNQLKYMTAWADKLNQDKIKEGADYAILATTVFPAGKKELDIDECGVILINPARVMHLVHVLRELMIEMHRRGLGQKDRVGKTSRLYEYITSNEYKQHFDQADTLNEELGEALLKEKKLHEKLWEERRQLLLNQHQALREIHVRVGAIIEGPAVERTPAA